MLLTTHPQRSYGALRESMPSAPGVFHAIRHPQKRAFLTAFRNTGNVRKSTEAAGVDRTTFYKWCEHDEDFALAAELAKAEFGDLLEEKLSQMVFEADNVTALIVALKMAGRFVEKTRNELTGADGRPIQIEHGELSEEELDDRLAAIVEQVTTAGRPALPEPAAAVVSPARGTNGSVAH